MVCEKCGLIVPFADEELETAISRLAERVTFEVSEHDILYGVAILRPTLGSVVLS